MSSEKGVVSFDIFTFTYIVSGSGEFSCFPFTTP
ncbi:MAG: hypothetical protein JWP44_509 [Mucilaginibacter sp.]|nr:hypothetical protein [Mucilaginibacter sp.]